MRIMTAALPALLLAACASAPAPRDPATLRLPGDGRVAVSWADPASFSEHSCDFAPGGNDASWVRDLAEYTRKQAEKRLPAGAMLDVHFDDIDRAGECFPGRVGEQYRIVKDIYPPRIVLHYRLSGAGAPSEGVARLTDLSFMMSNSPLDSDPRRFEKRLVDDWLKKLTGNR